MANPLGIVARLTHTASDYFNKLDKLLMAGRFENVVNKTF